MAMWVPDISGRRGPNYLRIVEAMAADIAAGRLRAGQRLPPHRDLAYRLGLSANTTSRAYAEGVRRALLRGEAGRGTFIRAVEAPRDGDSVGDLRRDASGPIDLSRNLPLSGLAEPHIRRVLADIGRNSSLSALLDYQTEADITTHADAAVRWLAFCGLAAKPDEIVVTNGAQHGLFCTLMALLRPGDLLLVEALSYPPLRAIADRLGITIRAVAMDADGLCPMALEQTCSAAAPKALYLTPTLQTPTTATLSSSRRREIAEIARRRDLLLIEDDVYGLLKSDRPAPIATLAPEQTVYVTSLSKTVAPGLRVGFLRAPARLVPALCHAVRLSNWMTPPVTSEIAAGLILDGTAIRLAEDQRAAAARRQVLARDVLAGHAYAADPEGLHLWVPLPEGWRGDIFRLTAEERGVLVSEARTFAADHSGLPEAIRICLSHEGSEERLLQGLEQIRTLLGQAPIRGAMLM